MDMGGSGAGGAVCRTPYICSCCERTGFGAEPDEICWCGFEQRSEPGVHEFFCMRLDQAIDKPWLRDAFGHSGVNVDNPNIKVAMISRFAVKTAEERWEKNAK